METINHECYVSLEVAKLLKEAGFDWSCNHAICCDSTHYPNLKEGYVLEYNHLECSELMEGKKPHMLLCPTLDVAQRWLREVKKLYIEIRRMPKCDLFDRYFTSIAIMQEPFDTELRDKDDEIIYISGKTYEETKEAGIKKALELILEKGE